MPPQKNAPRAVRLPALGSRCFPPAGAAGCAPEQGRARPPTTAVWVRVCGRCTHPGAVRGASAGQGACGKSLVGGNKDGGRSEEEWVRGLHGRRAWTRGPPQLQLIAPKPSSSAAPAPAPHAAHLAVGCVLGAGWADPSALAPFLLPLLVFLLLFPVCAPCPPGPLDLIVNGILLGLGRRVLVVQIRTATMNQAEKSGGNPHPAVTISRLTLESKPYTLE